MEDQYVLDDKEADIRKLLYDGQYEIALTQVNDLYKEIKHTRNMREELWFIYYTKSFIYMKQNKIDLAKKYVKKCASCTNIRDKKLKTMWMSVFLNNDNLSKSKKIYLRCSREYKKANRRRLRIAVLFNIAKLDRNKTRMLNLMIILKNTDNVTYKNSYKDTDKNNILKNGLIELLDVCVKDRDLYMINKIKKSFNQNFIDEQVKKLVLA